MGIVMVYSILLAQPAMSAQNTIYFLPQHSVIQEPSNNMTVQVRANLSANSPINVWQTNISFDRTCVNITDFTLPDPATGWSHSRRKYHEGGIEISALRFACGDAGNDILLANLTIQSEKWSCISPLNFTGIVNAARFIGCTESIEMYHAIWINGTVRTEEQHGEEQHAPGGVSTGDGRFTPSPSPIPSSSPTAIPTPTGTATPTLAPNIMPPPTTPTQTPTPTPTLVPRLPPLFLTLIVVGVIVITGIIIIIVLRSKDIIRRRKYYGKGSFKIKYRKFFIMYNSKKFYHSNK